MMGKPVKITTPRAHVRLADGTTRTLHEAADRIAESGERPYVYALIESDTGTTLLQATITDDTELLDHIEGRLKQLRKASRADKRIARDERKDRLSRIDHIETVLEATWKAETVELKARAKEARKAERQARREEKAHPPGAGGGRSRAYVALLVLATAVAGGGALYTMQGAASTPPTESEALATLETRVDLTTALLLGDTRAIEAALEDETLPREDRRLLVPYLVTEGRIAEAVEMSGEDHQLVADQISRTGDWADLETFHTEYPTANGQFDLAYQAKDWETVVATRGVTETPERRKWREEAEQRLAEQAEKGQAKKAKPRETQGTKTKGTGTTTDARTGGDAK